MPNGPHERGIAASASDGSIVIDRWFDGALQMTSGGIDGQRRNNGREYQAPGWRDDIITPASALPDGSIVLMGVLPRRDKNDVLAINRQRKKPGR